MFRFDRRLLLNFDWVLIFSVIAVVIMGLANLYSATYTSPTYGTPIYLKQLYFLILGIGVIAVIVSLDYRILINWNYGMYTIMIILLILTLVIGKSISHTQRWLDLGPFNIQPSEPSKLVLVITLASYYARKDAGKGFAFKELLVPIGLTGLPFLLVLKQPDLGTALMFGFIFLSMTLFVKLKWSTIGILTGICGSAVPLAWKFFLKPYQRLRIQAFLNPESDPQRSGYHILQSKIAVGSGTKFGRGYLQGSQVHLDFLPERHTDFAFSVWAEEWGFVGSLFFLACYFFFILWGLNTALGSKDKFGVLLAYGIVSLIFWQAVINLAMVLGLLPVVGMPLPLISYGGSSLLTTLAGIGIIINIRMRRFMAPI
jgi:rod shape determining protein RodA